jgi:hypothetical protein
MEMLSVKRDWGRNPKSPNQNGLYRCSKCRDWKDPSEFNKNKKQKSGLNYACRVCMKADTRKYNLPAKYGITAAKFAEMLLAQGGKCACCGEQFKMEGKASQGKLLKLDPLDGGSNKVLNLIVSTPGIENPRDEFVLNIIQRSQNKLSKQIGMHEKNILEAVRTGNIPMVEWKINEIIDLADIFN